MQLEKINQTGDVKKIAAEDLPELAEEIRRLIIDVVSQNGGHLSSNLGVVELTLVLHRLLNLEKDVIVWDVGHQVYTHKILTGRKDAFRRLRTYGGISGFPNHRESSADLMQTGHSSTSIATGLGLACSGKPGKTVVVIGDASLGGGVAFEGLNQAAVQKTDICVILNANDMAISATTGGLALSLTRLITNPLLDHFRQHTRTLIQRMPFLGSETITFLQKIEEGIKNLLGPAALFENLGFRYFGPFDGHNVPQLSDALAKILEVPGPRLVHVVTRKGRGYKPAEEDPERFHSAAPFSVATGKPSAAPDKTYREVFTEELLRAAAEKPEIIAITAAMARGTGLQPFRELYPDRFFDVGIAEQEAVAFAGGLARAGKHPVVAVYATFFQRGFDQLFQEVCLQGLPVTFVLPNNGLVGEDGPTHHSTFSFSYLRSLPGLSVAAPFSYRELRKCLAEALNAQTPYVVLFPKDSGPEDLEPLAEDTPDVSILAAGSIAETAGRAALKLRAAGVKTAFRATTAVKPLDGKIVEQAARAKQLVIVEENSICGGFGSAVLEYLSQKKLNTTPVKLIGVPDRFITFGSRPELLQEIGLDADGIYRQILDDTNSSSKNRYALILNANSDENSK